MYILFSIILVVVLGFSVNEYLFSKRIDTSSFTISDNKRYGVNALRQTYAKVMSTILLSFLVGILALTYVYKQEYANYQPIEKARVEIHDSIFMNLEAPPITPIQTINGDFKITKETGADAKESDISEKSLENPKDRQDQVTSDEGNKSTKEAKKTKKSSGEQAVYDLEKELYESSGGAAKREKMRQEMEEKRKLRSQQAQQGQAGQAGGTSNSSAKKGKALVSWELGTRTPHNNDRSNIGVPSYTCEQGSTGVVVISIKVDALGNVVDAKVRSKSSDSSPCIVEQSLKYAKLSRFNSSSKSTEEGTIEYTFVP